MFVATTESRADVFADHDATMEHCVRTIRLPALEGVCAMTQLHEAALEGRFVDMEFSCADNDDAVCCHAVVVCSASPVLASAAERWRRSNGDLISMDLLSGESRDTIKALVELMYLGRCRIRPSLVRELWRVADLLCLAPAMVKSLRIEALVAPLPLRTTGFHIDVRGVFGETMRPEQRLQHFFAHSSKVLELRSAVARDFQLTSPFALVFGGRVLRDEDTLAAAGVSYGLDDTFPRPWCRWAIDLCRGVLVWGGAQGEVSAE